MRPSRPIVVAFGIVLLIAVGLFGYTARLGWWGGPVTRWVPATVAPPAAERGTVVVFWSGDMGFDTGMGPRIADRIAAHGLPVLGVNSLTVFRSRRTPAEVDAMVRATTAAALARPGAARVVLIGQSFGANALLEGIDDLPAGLKARVRAVVLVVPGETKLYRATPGGFLDFGGDDGPALPAARALDWAPALCVHGEIEAESLCPIWHQRNVRAVALPGDHYLRHDDAAVAREVLGMIARTA